MGGWLGGWMREKVTVRTEKSIDRTEYKKTIVMDRCKSHVKKVRWMGEKAIIRTGGCNSLL